MATEPRNRETEAQRVRALVDSAQQGEREALEERYLIHYDLIYSYLHLTGGNLHDAEDLTTQTFMKMLESIGRFRWGTAPFSAWLFRIAHNLAMDHFRASKRWQLEEEVPEPEPDEATSAEAIAFDAIDRKSMLELIDDLSNEQQQVLTLKFVFGFSNGEAATILDKTEGAVKSLQHRALVTLQKKLERQGPAPTAD
jgi:RNA polymerase sigma-70 factor (ECF subfamily)